MLSGDTHINLLTEVMFRNQIYIHTYVATYQSAEYSNVILLGRTSTPPETTY